MSGEKRYAWWAPFAGWGVWFLMQIIGRTLKMRIVREMDDREYECTGIYSMWHNRNFICFYAWQVSGIKRKMYAFTSASRDGAIIEWIARFFGMGCVRGSSHRRGGQALLESLSVLKQGHCIAITPDGPKGPIYKIHPGVIIMASKTGFPIIPICVEYKNCWRIHKAWDHYCVPKPFSEVSVVWKEKLFVPPNINEQELAHYVHLLEEMMSCGCPDLTSLSSCK